MDADTLRQRLEGIEWDDLELKAAAGGVPEDAYKTVCAFANSGGGWLVFGVRDHAGEFEISGLADPDKVQNDFLTTCRSPQKFSRPLELGTKNYTIDGHTVLAFYVTALPRFDKPLRVRVKKEWHSYIRVGSGDHRCNEAEEARLLRDASYESFDSAFCDVDLDDLDPDAISWLRGLVALRYRQRINSEASPIEFLFKSNLADESGRLTHAAALLFGGDHLISRFKPAGMVDFRLYYRDRAAGDLRWDDREFCAGNLVATLRSLAERFYRLCPQPFAMESNGLQSRAESDDFIAVREALVNLLVHQDYSDRHRIARILWYRDAIIFENPGDSWLTLDQVLSRGVSSWRNPLLVQVMRQAGFADQASRGLRDIFRIWREAGREQPHIDNDPGGKTYCLQLPWQEFISHHPAAPPLEPMLVGGAVSRPSGAPGPTPYLSDLEGEATQAAFLRTFRQRFRSVHSRWDLTTAGVVQAGGRSLDAALDDMYLPLRLGAGWSGGATDQGAVIRPEELVTRDSPLVIRGPLGSGKTTWMRWTFRRLLAMERALPIMVVLRDLARRWQVSDGPERSLDAFLERWIAEHLGSGWEGHLRKVLTAPDGPRPVLLVDGWDEVGRLGEEVRQKLLGFMAQYPRLIVVVSSRPYGEGRPSHSDGFEVLDVQPLSDSEIAELATRFFTQCHGGDSVACNRDREHFLRALKRSPEARSLVRTALLLTVTLLISRSRPLPDKRHLLYEAYVESLLTALPDRREEEGAVPGREQWRPADGEERIRVVAALAFHLQEGGYKTQSAAPISRSWDEMATLLPESWSPPSRLAFLAWLAGPAGLLADRADGTLAFAHLSLQQYLTAWHLNAAVEGEQRASRFVEYLPRRDWWETLLLWAALIQRQSLERLDAVVETLRKEGEPGLALVGMMLADGLGSAAVFSAWIEDLRAMAESHWPEEMERCRRAWSTSRQKDRREQVLGMIKGRAAKVH